MGIIVLPQSRVETCSLLQPSSPAGWGDERKGWEAEGITLRSAPSRGSRRAVHEFLHRRAPPPPSIPSQPGGLPEIQGQAPFLPGAPASQDHPPRAHSPAPAQPLPSSWVPFLGAGPRWPVGSVLSPNGASGPALSSSESGCSVEWRVQRAGLLSRLERQRRKGVWEGGGGMPRGAGLVKSAQWICLGHVTPSLPPENGQ